MERKLDIPGYVLDGIFNESGLYSRGAAQLLDLTALRRGPKAGHWLCLQINDTAKAVTPATWASKVEQVTVRTLVRAGFPVFIARYFGSGAGLGVKLAAGTSWGHVAVALRVTISVVCPDLARCPARTDVLKAYATPALAVVLRDAVEDADDRPQRFEDRSVSRSAR